MFVYENKKLYNKTSKNHILLFIVLKPNPDTLPKKKKKRNPIQIKRFDHVNVNNENFINIKTI